MRLRFDDPTLERGFRRDHDSGVLYYQRLALLVSMGLVVSFGVLDFLVAPENLQALWTIRYLVMVPVMIAGFLLLWVGPGFVRRRAQLVMSVLGVLVALGITAMTVVVKPPIDYLYYAGLILVVMFIDAWCRLRLAWASITGITILVTYGVAVFSLADVPWQAMVNNGFFLVASVIVGTGTALTLEQQARWRFLDLRIIARDRETLSQFNGRLSRLATVDHLTGLLNRRVLDERLSEALALSRRYGTPGSLLMVDLDGFKQINDRLGHGAGDEVLRAVAKTMLAQVRETYRRTAYFVRVHIRPPWSPSRGAGGVAV